MKIKITDTPDQGASNNGDDLIAKTQDYLSTYPYKQIVKRNANLKELRTDIIQYVKSGHLTEAIASLEELREAKTGIHLHKMNQPQQGKVPILIRDAREAKNPPIRETEAFEIQYLNIIRGAKDLSEMENNQQLITTLQKEANIFIAKFHGNNSDQSQAAIAASFKSKVADIAQLLEKHGITNAYNKLNVAKDFQNFNDKHADIITISRINDVNNNPQTIIEAEVGFRELTKEQRKEYDSIRQEKKPNWYTQMPNLEQKLVQKYTPQITDGKHSLSAQLRQIVGMKNAFEKITAIVEDSNKIKILNRSKHAGTLVSLARDTNSRQNITEQNIHQAQEWIGKDRTLHINTLNTGFAKIMLPAAIKDSEIVRRTKMAADKVGAKYTNTAFNKFRLLGAFSDLTGVKDVLQDVASQLPDDDPQFRNIKSHIKPRGLFSRLFGINAPKGGVEADVETLLHGNKIDANAAKILKNAISLRKDVETADVPYRLFGDTENISLDISSKLSYLTQEIAYSNSKIFDSITKCETLTICASGKDRTGLGEQDQTNRIIAQRLGIDVRRIDRALSDAGHTGFQAGGVRAGGTTVGCYGMLEVASQGFPESRKKELQGIIEISSATNKISSRICGKSRKIASYKNRNSSELPDTPSNVRLISCKLLTPDDTPTTQRSNNREL